MIEICKQLTINIFWVLAAIFQVTFIAVLVIGILSNLIEKLNKKDGEE
jgi:putative effector of murein hydrolase LrgA (UPF0299 family)